MIVNEDWEEFEREAVGSARMLGCAIWLVLLIAGGLIFYFICG